MQTIGIIWQISLFAAVLGFWPALFLIFSVWGHYNREDEGFTSKRVREWFPVIVYPWLASVGVFFAIFLYLVFFVARR